MRSQRLLSKHLLGALLALAAPVVLATLPTVAEAAGPWRGFVVDAATREPVEGAVVVGVWRRYARGHFAIPIPFNAHSGEYWTSEEVTTDADGRLLLPWRILIDPGFNTHVRGPDLLIFKSGYGGWRFDPSVQWPSLLDAGATIEIEPLDSAHARRMYVSGMRVRERFEGQPSAEQIRRGWRNADGPPRALDVPPDRRARYDSAIDDERALLGLQPRPVPGAAVPCTRLTMDGCE